MKTIAVILVCLFLFCTNALSQNENSILCKIEVMPNGVIHHIFINTNVNIDEYPVEYRLLPKTEDNLTKTNIISKTPYWGTTSNIKNTRDEKTREITDKIISISNNLSGNLLQKKYQLREIETLNKTLQTLQGIPSSAFTNEMEERMEQIKAQNQAEVNRLRTETEMNRARIQSEKAQTDAEMNRLKWDAERTRINNIIDNKWP